MLRISIMSIATMLVAVTCGSASSVAWAAPITVEFEGHMSWVDDPFNELDDSFFYGAPLRGGFTFDPDLPGPDLLPDNPNIGAYSLDYTLWLEAGSVAVATNPFRISVWNDIHGGSGDLFQPSAVNFESDGQMYDVLNIQFQDPSGNLYDGIDLPDSIAFDDFPLIPLALVFDGNTPAFGGWIESMIVTPEPSSTLVLIFGLTLLLAGHPNCTRKRRTCRAHWFGPDPFGAN